MYNKQLFVTFQNKNPKYLFLYKTIIFVGALHSLSLPQTQHLKQIHINTCRRSCLCYTSKGNSMS